MNFKNPFRVATCALLIGSGLMVVMAYSNPAPTRARLLVSREVAQQRPSSSHREFRAAVAARQPDAERNDREQSRLEQSLRQMRDSDVREQERDRSAFRFAQRTRRKPARPAESNDVTVRILKDTSSGPRKLAVHLARKQERHPPIVSQTVPEPMRSSVAIVELGPVIDSGPELPRIDAPTIQRNTRPQYHESSTAIPFSERTPSGDTREVDAKLATLQRQVDRLAQVENNRRANILERASQMLEAVQQGKPLPAFDQDRGKPSAADSNDAERNQLPPSPFEPKTSDSDDSDRSSVLESAPSDMGPERFSLNIQDAEISEVLGMLSQLAGINILVGRNVTGKVTANLKDVNIELALHAILRSSGFQFERDGELVFVMTADEAESRKRLARKLITKVYRPHYISAKDLETLIVPVLTEGIGKVATTNPSEVGIAHNAESAGGDQLAQRDAILVIDYEEVIFEIDAIFEEMDVPPLQVAIDAMILSVQLSDEMAWGVNFAILANQGKQLFVSGNGATLDASVGFPGVNSAIPLPPMGKFVSNNAEDLGLKYGFIQGDASAFIQALETIAETSLVASPQLRVLNKQKAEIVIGKRLAYTTVTNNGVESIETVNFLDVGTKLLLRPFISPDGLIRMEVHPEQSSGEIVNGLPDTRTTEVTTNVMIRDGQTLVIGGLIDEHIEETRSQIPLLGSLPFIGNAFVTKTDSIVRNELIILLTPRIVREPEAAAEGELFAAEGVRRAENFSNTLSPLNRTNLARMKFERALYHFEHGHLLRARHFVNDALRVRENYGDAVRLRDEIEEALGESRRRFTRFPFRRRPLSHRALPQKGFENEPAQ